MGVTVLTAGFDLDTLAQSGDFLVVSPVHGQTGNPQFVTSLYGNVSGNVVAYQRAVDAITGTVKDRHKLGDGTGWAAWTTVGSGGGGGGGADSAVTVTSVPHFDTIISQQANAATYSDRVDEVKAILSPYVPTAGSVEEALLVVLDLILNVNFTLDYILRSGSQVSSYPIYGRIFAMSADPDATYDAANTSTHGEFSIGDVIINQNTKDTFICVDNATNAAVWKKFTFAS